jgi:hypothetical protein
MEQIESYGNAYVELVEGLKQFPKEMWQFKPLPTDWSIHEIIIHLADSEANSYVRCRRFIAEPGDTVLGYNENTWANVLDYHNQSTDESLELFRWLRHNSYQLIKSLPDAVWSNTVNHTENGIMTFQDWLDVYEEHVHLHLRQMRDDYEIWLKQK